MPDYPPTTLYLLEDHLLYAVGPITAREWADAMLREGHDAPALVELALLGDDEDTKVGPLLSDALAATGVPTEREAAARFLFDQIVRSLRNPTTDVWGLVWHGARLGGELWNDERNPLVQLYQVEHDLGLLNEGIVVSATYEAMGARAWVLAQLRGDDVERDVRLPGWLDRVSGLVRRVLRRP